MLLDMKFYNVYYFCDIANETMGEFDFLSTNAQFVENYTSDNIEDFPKVSILRDYCIWLVERILFEQANHIDNYESIDRLNPISWINQALFKYKNIDVKKFDKFEVDYDDFRESYNNYFVYLEEHDIDVYDVFENIAEEVEYILFQNRDFLLRFNINLSSAFEDAPRKRVYIPEWTKRAVFFRDRGCCVFCKKDLGGLVSILEDGEKQFDHIVPLAQGGLNDVCNLQLTCNNCNFKKSDNVETNTIYPSAY